VSDPYAHTEYSKETLPRGRVCTSFSAGSKFMWLIYSNCRIWELSNPLKRFACGLRFRKSCRR
jgi:hypothetical protein